MRRLVPLTSRDIITPNYYRSHPKGFKDKEGATMKSIIIICIDLGDKFHIAVVFGGIPVRVGSRVKTPLFDWENPGTWKSALDKIHMVCITFPPDPAVPGARKAIENFTTQAAKKGIQKIVLLAGRWKKSGVLFQ